MRYNTPIYFESVCPGEYDEQTGNYGAPTVQSARRLASVVETSEERMNLIYGSIRKDSRTVTLLNAYRGGFDRIRIGGKLYAVDRKLTLRTKQAFVVSEIQGGASCQGHQ